MPTLDPMPLPALASPPVPTTTPPPSVDGHQSPLPKRPRPVLTAKVDEAARTELVADALAAMRKAVDVITQTFADGGGDFDDAIKALPQLHRILEHAEKLEAQATDTQSQVPLIINFGRAPHHEGFVVDVRSGRQMAELRHKAQSTHNPDTI